VSTKESDISTIEHHNMLEYQARSIIQKPNTYPSSTLAIARVLVRTFDSMRERGDTHDLMM
jgi:hypothetical protein